MIDRLADFQQEAQVGTRFHDHGENGLVSRLRGNDVQAASTQWIDYLKASSSACGSSSRLPRPKSDRKRFDVE